VDDSDHECLAVRSELPQIEVVKTPGRPTDIPACLDRVARLQVLRLTDEDRQKTELYVQERRRREFSAATSDLASYLASLEMRMRVRYNDATALGRLAQLTQKTNQFNLTTRRYTEAEIQAFIAGGEWLVAHFSLADIFGDSGIVGLALVRLGADATAELDTFLMSCRVIGRAAESAFLDTILRTLQSRGYGLVHARFIPTAKNKLAERFLPDHAFDAVEGNAYRRDLREAPPAGEGAYPIRVEIAEAAGSPARPASSPMPG
jgi:FkbH-like protein